MCMTCVQLLSCNCDLCLIALIHSFIFQIRYLDQEESITGKKKREVTSIASSPVGDQLAVGYQDGKVRY